MKAKTLQKSVQSKIDAAKSAFELAFRELRAAKEVASHDDKTLRELISQDIISIKDLDKAISSVGWATSSLIC